MTIIWDGIIRSELLKEDEVTMRHQLADAAKQYNWEKTLKILNKCSRLINVTRPDGISLYTPLHQAAHGNAPVKVVEQMLAIGAWKTLRNADGEKPVDIAKRKKHQSLIDVLEPVYRIEVSLGTLQKIQKHFHITILSRIEKLEGKSALRLPELEPLLEIEPSQMWFAVPGMYGGFSYWLQAQQKTVKLISESWCRVVGGSGQHHEITSNGSILVDEGFV